MYEWIRQIEKVLKMRTAIIPAEPIPAIPRPTSMVGMLWLPVLIALPTMKNARDSWSAQCRPHTSASEANNGRNTEDVRRYTVPI